MTLFTISIRRPALWVATFAGLAAVLYLLSSALIAGAAPAPKQLKLACASRADGTMRYVARASQCRGGATLVRLSPGPVDVCVKQRGSSRDRRFARLPVGSTRLVPDLSQCAPANRRNEAGLKLPNRTRQWFCALRTNGTLRWSRRKPRCTKKEILVFVPAASTPPTTPGQPANTAPAAFGDGATTDENSAATVAVLANDTDAEADPLRVASVDSSATVGAASVNSDGTVSYDPRGRFEHLKPGQRATDTFSYRANDGGADSAPATVTITVIGVNDAPVAVANADTTDEDTVKSIVVLANDIDVEGDALGIASIDSAPATGALTQHADGTVGYSPAGRFEDLGAGESRTDTFRYTATDGRSESNLAAVTVTVTGLNDLPTAAADSGATSEDTSLAIDVTANDADADGDVLSVAPGSLASADTDSKDGALSVDANGDVVYDPRGQFDDLKPGDSPPTDAFSYRASDGHGDSNEATVTVTVGGVNDAPIGLADSASTGEDASKSIDVLANDTDAEGDALAIKPGSLADADADASDGALSIVAGKVSYDPSGKFDDLPQGQTRTDEFTYVARDAGADSQPVTVTVTVTGVNDVPVAVADSASTGEDTAKSIDVLANDTDAEGAPLTIKPGSLADADADASDGALSIVAGKVSYDPSGRFDDLGQGQTRSDKFTYVAQDAGAESQPGTVTVTVTGVNEAPVAVADSASTGEDTAKSIDVLANDTDAEGDALTIKAGSLVDADADASDGALSIVAGKVSYDPSGRFDDLPQGQTRTDTFSYVANDGAADSGAANVTVTVTGVNDAPTVAARDTAVTAAENGSALIDDAVAVSDADASTLPSASVEILSAGYDSAHDSLALTGSHPKLSASVVGGKLTLTAAAGETPTVQDFESGLRAVQFANDDDEPTASRTIRFTVDDGVATTSDDRPLTITPANDAPVVSTSGGPFTYTENDPPAAIVSSVSITDPDNAQIARAEVRISSPDPLPSGDVLQLTGTHTGITPSYAGGVLELTGSRPRADYEAALADVRYSNTGDDPGSDARTVGFRVGDGAAWSATTSQTIGVVPANDAPQITLSASPATTQFSEDAVGPVAVDDGLTVGDADSTQMQSARATISATGYQSGPDTLAWTSSGTTGSITAGSFDSTARTIELTGSGTVGQYQAALRRITFHTTSNDPGTSRTVTLEVRDAAGAWSSPAARTISITPSNDAPVLSTPTFSNLAYDENQAATAIDPNLAITDPDSATLSTATVEITDGASAGDVLAGTGAGSITVTPNASNTKLTISGSGTLDQYRQVLAGVTFRNTSENPSGAPRTVSFQVDDGGSSASTSNMLTRVIDVRPVNDAPTVATTTGSDLAYTEGDGPKVVDSGVSVADVDSQILGATVQVESVTSQDVLDYADTDGSGTGIDKGSYNGATGLLTLTGTASPAAYAAALSTVTYANTSESPAPPTRTVRFQVTDAGSPNTPSNTAARGIAITAVNDAPTAVDDGATTTEDAVLTVTTAPGVLGNDTDPDAGDTRTVTKLNGVALSSGTATQTFGNDRTVTIHSDGTYSFDPGSEYQRLAQGASETFPFTYTMEDSSHAESTATVTVTITGLNDAPTAQPETVHASGNTALYFGTTKPSGQAGRVLSGSVTTNDTDPDTANASLTATPETKATAEGGSVTIAGSGAFTYLPQTGDERVSDSFTYTLNDGAGGTSTGTVTLPVGERAWYVDADAAPGGNGRSTEPFQALGAAEAASDANDTVYAFGGAYTAGYALAPGERLIGAAADLRMDPDGAGALPAETYFTGSAAERPGVTASVQLDDGNELRGLEVTGSGTDPAVVGASGDVAGTLADLKLRGTDNTGLQLWFTSGAWHVSDLDVQNAGAPGVTLLSAGTVDFAPAGRVTIHTTGATGLSASATALGTSQFDDVTATGSDSGGVLLNGTSGTIALGDGDGTDLDLTTTSGTSPALDLNSVGTVTVDAGGTDTISATGGPAVRTLGAPGAQLTFDSVSSAASSTDGISLGGLGGGTFSATGGSVGGATGASFSVSGGSGDITYPGNLNDGSGQAATISGRTGGAIALSGQVADTSDAGGGIVLTSNSGGSTTFSGTSKQINMGSPAAVDLRDAVLMQVSDGHTLQLTGGGLDIDAAGVNRGIAASTSGTLTVSGSGNTIDTATGRALSVENTDIGAGGLNFKSISSSGAANGIRLTNTGSAGGLGVVDATPGSGGTIGGSTGPGVLLTDVPGGVNLTRMGITGGTDDGIRATRLSGFSLTDSTVSSNGDGDGESGLDFTDATGTVSLFGNTISNNKANGVSVVNDSGNIAVNVEFGSIMTTVGGSAGAPGNGLLMHGTGTGSQSLTVMGTSFSGNSGDHLRVSTDASNSVQQIVSVPGLTMSGTGAQTGGGIAITPAGNASVNAAIYNSSISRSSASAGGAPAIKLDGRGALLNAWVSGVDVNFPGGNGVEVSGYGSGTVNARVQGMDIRNYKTAAVDVVQGGGNGVVNASLYRLHPFARSATAVNGIHARAGTGSGDSGTLCLDAGNTDNAGFKNNIAGGGANSGVGGAFDQDIFVEQRFSTTVRLPGYGGGSLDTAAVASYLRARNDADSTSPTAGAAADGLPGFLDTPGSDDCPQPPSEP